MSKKLAILGHEHRGNEVVELLKMLGGKDADDYNCSNPYRFYYISDEYEYVHWDYDDPSIVENKFEVFTLEEVLEKFPFKVGDFVRIPEYESEVRICKMKWCPLSEHIEYLVYRNDDEEWYTTDELLNYNDDFLENKHLNEKQALIQPRQMYLFNPHDFVIVESDNKKQKWICEYKSYVNNKLYFYKGTYDIYSDDKEKLMYDSFYDVAPSDIIRVASPVEITQLERLIENPNVVISGIYLNSYDYADEVELNLGDYEIEVRGGRTYAVRKNPKYPTTYEECCQHLGCDDKLSVGKLIPFQQLINARNAYWKIVGKEMGLDKPWEPDWNHINRKFYCIYNSKNNIVKNVIYSENKIIAFPNEEMRDAFYENFKDLIERCKEFL